LAGRFRLHGLSCPDAPSPAFHQIVACAPERKAINFIGGCGNLDIRLADVVSHLAAALSRVDGSSFAGALISGDSAATTLAVRSGIVSVTQIPLYLGRVERFNVLRACHLLNGHARLQAAACFGPNRDNFDVTPHMDCLDQLRRDAHFNVCNVAINGGVWTWAEIREGLIRGIPTILLKGSLRATDAFITALSGDRSPAHRLLGCHSRDEAMDFTAIDRRLIRTPEAADVKALRQAFIDFGML
jgi:hypothetical protein